MRPGEMHKLVARLMLPLTPLFRIIESRLLARDSSQLLPPVLFVIGSPRNGTTLTYQCLTHCLEVYYPSHLAALFPRAPVFGMWLNQLIYKNSPHRSFRSIHGYSLGDGLLSPDEWETLFRKYIFPDLQPTLSSSKTTALFYLNKITKYLCRIPTKPLVLKSLEALLHIDILAELIPSSKFLYVQRAHLDVARSIYRAKRLEKIPTEEIWYIRPPRIKKFRFPTEAHQIAAQILEIDRVIEESFSRLPSSRKEYIRYERLCESPKGEIDRLARWLSPSVKKRREILLPSFVPSHGEPLPDKMLDEILRAELC